MMGTRTPILEIWISWLDLLHLHTQLVTTSNNNTVGDFHTTNHWNTQSLLSLHESYPDNGFISLTVTTAHVKSSNYTLKSSPCKLTLKSQLNSQLFSSQSSSTAVSRGSLNYSLRVRVTLRLQVYCQSVRRGVRPLEAHDQNFFFNWTLAIIVHM
jgi:hypothetical protein